jgi:NAD(P)-dependent dehydrogenase (short-subunit alcohol dehydrogenase family)
MINPLDLTGKRFLVTGASSGIGRAVAILLSQLGGTLLITARDRERLAQTREQLAGEGHVVDQYDLSELDGIPAWIRRLAGQTGPFDGLVHCAGITTRLPVRAQSAKQADALMQTNWSSSWLLAKGFRQAGVHTTPASLVFVSSVVAMVGQPGLSAYASSKGALLALTKALAMELVSEGIRVNAVVPGYVQTEMAQNLEKILTADQVEAIRRMHPLGFGTAEDVAHAIAFLLAATGRWITGTALVVDGGYTAH